MQGKTCTLLTLLASLLVLAVVVLAVARPLSICSDDIRGYRREIAANLDVVESDMGNIGVGIKDLNNIQTSLQNLSAGAFAALRAMDSQCKFLSRCALLSLQSSAASACPREYADYQESVRTVLPSLLLTESLKRASSDAAAKADALSDAEANLEALGNSAGATGGRRTILMERAGTAEIALRSSLEDVQALIDELSAHFLNPE